LRTVLAAAVGPRGRWLLAANPAWRHFLAAGTVEDQTAADGPVDAMADTWLHGTLAERRAWLTQARRIDPATARTALADQWKTLKAKEKADLLPVLATGLSQADLPFLDTARTDRSSAVIDQALPLLARWPEGAYADRRAALMAQHFRLEQTGARLTWQVDAIPPDKAEGIPEGAALGVEAFVRWTPLALWPCVLGQDPVALTRLPRSGVEWDPATVFTEAAAAQGDHVLFARLLAETNPSAGRYPDYAAAAKSFPEAVRLAVVRRVLSADGVNGFDVVTAWLGLPWPATILGTCVSVLQQSPYALARPDLAAALVRLSPSQCADLRRLIDQVPDKDRPAALRTLGHVTLLTRLNQELS
jgi:hypothetical protein